MKTKKVVILKTEHIRQFIAVEVPEDWDDDKIIDQFWCVDSGGELGHFKEDYDTDAEVTNLVKLPDNPDNYELYDLNEENEEEDGEDDEEDEDE